MNQRTLLYLLSIFLLLTVYPMSPHQAVAAEKSVNQIETKSLSGQAKTLEEYKGRKVVVHFFATWCQPCQEEMPDIVDFSKKLDQEGIGFVPIHLTKVDPDLEELLAFLNHYQAPFDPWLDQTGEWMNQNHIVGIPTTIFLDEEGKEVQRVNGMLPPDIASEYIKANKKGD
ncbi:TlpA disulfide reductase family protein [Alkalihalobacillus sp. FSL R5-0424]